MSNLEMKIDALCTIILSEHDAERTAACNTLRVLMSETKRTSSSESKDNIKKALMELGVPDALAGHRYLEFAINLAIADQKILDKVTKVLYPKIAEEFGSTPSRVERAIRHAIEVAFDRTDYSVVTRYFGNTVSDALGKPTNTEFIARLANALR